MVPDCTGTALHCTSRREKHTRGP
ncbi:hypothetical protein CGCSCA4_v009994 [Colletotrichum siamense]|uniref:Uncharacterized protein n=1 Tax=Colletotrichum siamense TaxID=690259 RepID=A0A9P5EQ94_COLSI|nr:hypothetical protein CGCSCA5_v009483 [Colletotrichum siamense]KAF4840638.1 hypothetical protein CGCSCA4_v009994 [Colletotrichum siamense]KAF4857469.1 hypothetical protein CGCSCA2_v008221 [Colletotrichum siamense]KAF4871206.1 hypothetical protein CGCSCA1_v009643 [Colletotrichum siamense]